MPLTMPERKELTRLVVNNLDKNGKPLKEAKTEELERIEELLGRDDAPTDTSFQRIKGHKLSEPGQALMNAGADYLGCEGRNVGTEEKPSVIVREFFYRNDADDRREAVMVQQDRVIVIGRTIAENALRRLSK